MDKVYQVTQVIETDEKEKYKVYLTTFCKDEALNKCNKLNKLSISEREYFYICDEEDPNDFILCEECGEVVNVDNYDYEKEQCIDCSESIEYNNQIINDYYGSKI